jgi:hypothetical protein
MAREQKPASVFPHQLRPGDIVTDGHCFPQGQPVAVEHDACCLAPAGAWVVEGGQQLALLLGSKRLPIPSREAGEPARCSWRDGLEVRQWPAELDAYATDHPHALVGAPWWSAEESGGAWTGNARKSAVGHSQHPRQAESTPLHPPQQGQHIPPLHGVASPEARAVSWSANHASASPEIGVNTTTLLPSRTMTSVFRISQYSSSRDVPDRRPHRPHQVRLLVRQETALRSG